MRVGRWCAYIPEESRERVGALLRALGSRGEHPEEREELWEQIVPTLYEMSDDLNYSINEDDWSLRAWTADWKGMPLGRTISTPVRELN